MKKFLITLLGAILLVLSAGNSFGQTTLSVGELAIIGMDTPGEDFSFVCFVDLDEDTEIYFTDEEADGDYTIGTGEGTVMYTAPSGGLSAGTVVTYVGNSSDFTTTSDGIMILGNSGDGILAYQGTSVGNVTTFLHAIGEDAGDIGTFPSGFSNYMTFGADDGQYNGTRTGTASDLMDAINDNSNWTTSGSGVTPFTTTAFTISVGSTIILSSENPAVDAGNVAVGSYCSAYIFSLDATSTTGTFTDLSFTSTHVSGDIDKYQLLLWDTGTESGTLVADNLVILGSGTYSFNGFSETITGSEVYYCIRAVTESSATPGNTIQISTLTTSDITVTGDAISGTAYAGGLQTIIGSTITLSETNLTGFSYSVGNGPSAEQSFTVEGSNLTNDISLTPPTNYEISTTTGGSFSATNPITLTQSGGSVSTTTIYVRLKSGLSEASYNSEDITATSTGATDADVTCSGSVTAASSDCGSETFDNSNATGSYANNNFTGDNSVTWTFVASRDESTYGITGNGLMLRRVADNSKVTSSSVSGGIGEFTCSLRKAFTGSGNRQVELFVNGVSKGTSIAWDNTSIQTFTVSGINVSGSVIIEIRNITAYQVIVDDISWTCYSGTSPTITLSETNLTGFSYIEGSGPSAEQSFTVEGSNLTADISLVPPTNYEISTTTGGSFSATNPITLTQSGGSVSSTTIYVRLKSGLSAADYNDEDITASSTGATSQTVECDGSVANIADWCNVQSPVSGSINTGGDFNVYAQIYEAGITEAAGQGTGVTCWIGYSTSNDDPSGWTDWVAASFNVQSGNNDEFIAEIGSGLSVGTYYYASRFSLDGVNYTYGGYDGGFWNGTTNVNGTLTISANYPDWCNLQWPESGTIDIGDSYDVYAQVFESGVTEAAGAGTNVSCWIGYNSADTDPSTWTNWVAATFSSQQSNNDEFVAEIGSGLSTGTYYYASRFKVNPTADEYSYGGYNGGVWDGSTNISGVLTVNPPAGACATDLIISEYGEGSSGNSKYIEIYNGTGSTATLSNYRIWKITNGGTWPEATYDFTTGTLADGATLVIANNSGDTPSADEYDTGICSWNGDDAIGLAKNTGSWALIDVIGEDGADPGTGWAVAGTSNATANNTLARKSEIVAGNLDWDDSRGTDASDSEWIVASYSSGAATSGHTMSCGPTIELSETTLTGFTYIVGNGPSAEQSFTVIGTNLTANISIAAPTNYEISTTTGGSFSATDPITLTQSGGNVAETTIYVRLKASLTAGDYNSEAITATSTDATDKTVTCDGTVTTPTLSVSETALTGFDYRYGNGPSDSQSFTVEGTNLSNDLVVSAPTNYEVSEDDATFAVSVSLTPVSNEVTTTTIYVRLKESLAVGEYNLEDITISSTGATSETLACSGEVTLAPVTDLTVECTTNTTAVVTWTAPIGTYTGVVIGIRNSATLVPHTISDGTDPSTLTANTTFMSGTEFGSTTPYSYIVYKGAGTSVTIEDLIQGEDYKIKAYTYSGTDWINDSDCPTVSISDLDIPDVSSESHGDTDQQSELSWNNPSASCFDEVLIVCTQGASVTASPSGDGSSYSANSVFGSGTEITTNEYVVYKGTGTTMTITGLTNDITYYATIFVRNGTEWSVGVELILYPADVTLLEYGDLAIVAVNTNGTIGDEFSFVSFETISVGTSIDFTDNGYERLTATQWADSEGFLRFTRQNSSVGAGKVMTFETIGNVGTPVLGTNVNVYLDGALDNSNWTTTSAGSGSGFNFNSSDQIWVMQGGTWSDPVGSHNATYSGNVLYGWTAIGWETAPGYDDTAGSTIFEGAECATTNVAGLTNKEKVKYDGVVTSTTRAGWIGRINDPDNWDDYADNATYDAGTPLYKQDGATWSIEAGELTTGKWAGYKSGAWCDCSNWFSLVVPDSSIDVEIPTHDPSFFDLVLSAHADSLAYCNKLVINGEVYNDDGAEITIDDSLHLNGGTLYFNTNAIDITVGGHIVIDTSDNFNASEANFILDGISSQNFTIDGTDFDTISINSLSLTGGGTKTISDKLELTGNLLVDNSIMSMTTAASFLHIDGNITMQNGGTMNDNCKSNMDIVLSSTLSQTIQGSGNAIKALSITADKTDANLILSSTGGRSDLYIGTIGDFNMAGTSLFTDNGSIIQTDDDLYLGGDGSTNYSLTGIVRFTGTNVTGDMILSDDDGTSAIAAELYTLSVQGDNLEVYPVAGSQTIIVNNNFSVEATSTLDANSNDFEIGGNYYVNADAAFDASGITITLNGTSDQNITANSSQETFGVLIVDKASGDINLSDNIEVDDLSLTSGLINTGTNRVYVSNSAIANLSDYSASSYINGNLRREVNSSGNYNMPVGDASNYELANLDLNSSTGLTYLDVNFNPFSESLDISGLALDVGGSAVQTLVDGGFWTIAPNAGMTAVSYDIGLSLRGYTNAGTNADQHTCIKRDNGSSDWEQHGNHDNATQSIGGGTLYAYRANVSSFSDHAIAKNNTVALPVEIINFEIDCENAIADLSWITASEKNNDYFDIQKSEDGYTWYSIGELRGAGNSNQKLTYNFSDIDASKNSYYRLKQVDFDGQFEYSNIVSSTCFENMDIEIIAYPNPCDNKLNISISNWNTNTVKIEILDMLGRTVYVYKYELSNSFGFTNLDVSGLKSGLYNIRFTSTDKSVTKKFSKK